MILAQTKSRATTAGSGRLDVDVVAGLSAVTSVCAVNPLKLLTPCSRGSSVWAYASSFGGGLVAGDQTRLDITIGPGARCFVGTQASTKVYRNPALLPCGHVTSARVGSNALLVFAPDPVQAFAGSCYRQRQEFHLTSDSGLVLLDWFGSGRAARGERWAFTRFQSRNDIFISGERSFVDSLLLDESTVALGSQHRAGRFNCCAMLLFAGRLAKAAGESMLKDIAARPIERRAATICSASAVRDGMVLRIAGESVEQVGRELHRHLQPLAEMLGDDPWARKW